MTLPGSSPPTSPSSSDPLHLSNGNISVEDDTASERVASHGSISIVGRQRYMEDTMTIMLQTTAATGELRSYDFFAVYDGYGGARVSEIYRDRMHLILANEVRASGRGGDFDWEKLMCSCFEKMDAEVSCGSAVVKDGSMAVVVVVEKGEIAVGNFGVSRAVLCRGGVAIPLSSDLKHDGSDDMDRIQAAGGNNINWSGSQVVGAHANSRSIVHRLINPFNWPTFCCCDTFQLGFLISVPASRAYNLYPRHSREQFMAQCVISQSKVTINKRTDSDQFIILASDGLWGVLSDDIACDIVRKCLAGHFSKRFIEEKKASCSMEAAMMLVELAIARGSKDNITVIVVELNKLDV